MEKLLVVAVLLTACSCADSSDKSHQYKYKVGDVVYIKPDSSTAVIVDRATVSGEDRYEIKFYDVENESSTEYLHEYEIYGLK